VYEDDDDDDLPYCDEGDSEYDDGEDWSDSSSSQYDNPTPTPTYDQPATSQDNAQPTTTAQDSGNNNSGNVNYGGFATYYYQNGNPGACGDYKGDYDLIAAIDSSRYGDLGQKSGLCGQKVHIKNTNNGNTVEVTICDACPTCTNGNSIDLSVGAFQALASLNDGLIPIEWSFA
jgi:expansin (peptidoglycan-binding protein)